VPAVVESARVLHGDKGPIRLPWAPQELAAAQARARGALVVYRTIVELLVVPRRSSGLWRSECRVPVATPASVSTRCRTWSTHCFTGQACVETSPHADCRALWNRRCPRPLVFVQPALAFVPHLSVCGGCRSATTRFIFVDPVPRASVAVGDPAADTQPLPYAGTRTS
jgi:hypothetical protein